MSLEVANTIRAQIGHKALMMIGAKNLAATKDSFSFRIRGSKKANHIEIKLNGLDLYDITYRKIHGAGCKIVAEEKNVYSNQIHKSIETNTGLYTSL